jgi:cobalt-zinc-cadmium efflux system protein
VDHDHSAPVVVDRVLDRRLWATAVLNSAITVTELGAGFLSGSLALLSDAVHNLSDVVAIVLALWARWFARRPPTARHTYGFKRVEVVAALVNAMLLIGATVLIGREAVLRLLHPEPVAQGIMLVAGLVALVANVGSVLLLRHHDEDDVNVRGAFLHLAQDALASLAVVVAAALAHTAVGPYVDSAAALLVGVVVLRSGLSLAWRTLSTILEGAPADVDVAELAVRVGRAFAPARLHHVHVWEVGPSQRLLTAHVALGQEMDGRAIEVFLARMKSFLHEGWENQPRHAGAGDRRLRVRRPTRPVEQPRQGSTARTPSMVATGKRRDRKEKHHD